MTTEDATLRDGLRIAGTYLNGVTNYEVETVGGERWVVVSGKMGGVTIRLAPFTADPYIYIRSTTSGRSEHWPINTPIIGLGDADHDENVRKFGIELIKRMKKFGEEDVVFHTDQVASRAHGLDDALWILERKEE